MTRRNIAGIRFTSGYPDNKSYQNLFPLPVHGNYYQRVSLLHHRGRMWNCVCDSKISHLHRWFWAINQPFIFFLFFLYFFETIQQQRGETVQAVGSERGGSHRSPFAHRIPGSCAHLDGPGGLEWCHCGLRVLSLSLPPASPHPGSAPHLPRWWLSWVEAVKLQGIIFSLVSRGKAAYVIVLSVSAFSSHQPPPNKF